MASTNPYPVFCVTCRQAMDPSEIICPACGQDQRFGAPNIYELKLREQAAQQAILLAQQKLQAKATAVEALSYRVAPAKSKTTAVILAIFLGTFTWLYTYKYDAWKFWLGTVVSLLTLGVSGLLFTVWAIIEASSRPDSFYANYGA